MLLFALFGLFAVSLPQRALFALLFQLPPRLIRFDPDVFRRFPN